MGAFGERAGTAEMVDVHARREGMDLGMAAALRLVEAVAAGEDQVGMRDQLGLQREQLRRGEAEVRQLVHAVVDGAARRQVARESEHHRRVIPAHIGLAGARDEIVEERAAGRLGRVGGEAVRQQRRDRLAAAVGGGLVTQHGPLDRLEQRLLPEQHAIVLRQPRHQVLRPLEDEIPAQVRETDEQGRAVAAARPCRDIDDLHERSCERPPLSSARRVPLTRALT